MRGTCSSVRDAGGGGIDWLQLLAVRVFFAVVLCFRASALGNFADGARNRGDGDGHVAGCDNE